MTTERDRTPTLPVPPSPPRAPVDYASPANLRPDPALGCESSACGSCGRCRRYKGER